MRVLIEQILRRHDHAVDAIATLCGLQVNEGLLQRMRLVDGRAVRSCVIEIGAIGDAEITTIEGLGTVGKPHPLQQAFINLQAAQCGYCINGMIMTAKDLLDQNPHPNTAQVREGLAQNLCRCGTHGRIIRAVLRAGQDMRKS